MKTETIPASTTGHFTFPPRRYATDIIRMSIPADGTACPVSTHCGYQSHHSPRSERTLNPAEWEPVWKAECLPHIMEERKIDSTAYRFAAYRHTSRKEWLIITNHGGGHELTFIRDTGGTHFMEALATMPEPSRHDFCMTFILETARFHASGYAAAERDIKQAFVDGRLKKRKQPRQEKIKVWIEPTAA